MIDQYCFPTAGLTTKFGARLLQLNSIQAITSWAPQQNLFEKNTPDPALNYSNIIYLPNAIIAREPLTYIQYPSLLNFNSKIIFEFHNSTKEKLLLT